MARLWKAATELLAESDNFNKEKYLEGLIYSHPGLLASNDDNLSEQILVYPLEFQPKLESGKRADLACLIWNEDLQKYELWIYEFKPSSQSKEDIEQLVGYVEELKPSDKKRQELCEKAKGLVEHTLLDLETPRGALCAGEFSLDVLSGLKKRNGENPDKPPLLAVRIKRFTSEDNDSYVLVECFVGEERNESGGRKTFYDDIPTYGDNELKSELLKLLRNRRQANERRALQLEIALKLLVDREVVTQDMYREAWKENDLPRKDGGHALSQFLGFKRSGPLRQILTWDWVVSDIKDNYRLQDQRYAGILREVLGELGSSQADPQDG